MSTTTDYAKQTIENASNDIYRMTDGKVNLATRDISAPGSILAEQAGRYMSQASTSEENYFYEQSKRIDKIVAVTSLIVGDYEQNKTASYYEHVNFENNDIKDLMSYSGYGTKAQNYANDLLSSNSTIYTVTNSTGGPGPSSFNVSGQGMNVSLTEREEIKRTGQFTRTIDGHAYTYSVSSYQGQAITNAQVQSAVLTAEIEKTHQNSVIGKQGQKHEIAAYNKIKNDTIATFNQNLKSEGITFKTGSKHECDSILHDITKKQEAILNEAMANPAYASLHNDIAKLNKEQNDMTGFVLSSLQTRRQSIANSFDNQINNLARQLENPFLDSETKKNIQTQINGLKEQKKEKISELNRETQSIRRNGITDKQFNDAYSRASDADKAKFKNTPSSVTDKLNKKNGQILEIGDFQKRLNNLDEHKKHIETYRDNFSKGTSKNGSKASHRSANSTLMGARIVGKGLIGNDMQQGVDFYKKGYTVAKTSVKVVAKSTALAFTAAEHVGHAGVNWGLKLIDKHSTGRVNQTVNSLIGMNDKAHQGIKSIKDERKIAKEASRSGQKRDYRRERRETRTKNRLERRSSRELKLKNDVEGLRNKPNLSSKESRKLRAGERRLRRIDRRNGFLKNFDWIQKVKEKLGNLKKGIGSVLGVLATPFKLVAAPFQILNNIKKQIIKYLMGLLGGFLLVYIVLCIILIVFSIAIRFISSIVETDLTAIFDNRNYCQIIVDDVCENLSPQMEKVCMTDAENFYLNDTKGKVESERYDWYKGVNEGEIRDIVAAESDNDSTIKRDVPSVTSNLLPIVSMMHYRYEEEINFDNWQTARAYVYYMYVTSHNIEGYDYDNENDCDETNLYTNGSFVNYNTDLRVLIRPTPDSELCNNIYIHGYNKDFSTKLNELRAFSDEFLSAAIAVLNEQLGTDLTTTSNTTSGAWINVKPSDAKGECTNYKAFQLGTTDSDLNRDVCPGYTHQHSESCYGNTCGKTGHDSSCYNAQGQLTCTDDDHHSHTDDCRGLTCGKEVHEHKPWVDENNPGCYLTLYVCQGHCGGHITPQINIKQEMTFEALANLDTFKTPYFLTTFDFATANITANELLYRDLASWREHWMLKFMTWFVPFPKSPQAAIEYAYGKIAYNGAKGIDTITAFLSGNSDNYVEDPETAEDEFGFDGWFTESGELDNSLMNDLHSFYGVYDDNYKEGYQNWEDMGEVVFPVGNIRPLTSSQIANIMSQIKATYPSLSESRLKVIEEALSKVGKYSYDLSAEGHSNGIYGESGRSECSGFVSGVLYRALGDAKYTSGWSAATFANNGHSYSTPTPGDVLAHANGGMGQNGTAYTGHVVIYIGELTEGIDGYKSEACPTGAPAGHYVIECTNSYGINGSCIREIDPGTYFRDYSSAYTGCY